MNNNLVFLFCVTLTIGAYLLSRVVGSKYPSPFTTPVFFSTALIIVVLVFGGISVESYQPAKEFLTILLGPATVALAVPIYKNLEVFKKHWKPAVVGLVAGTCATISVATGVFYLFGMSVELITTISVKSVTVPIALEISQLLKGNPSLTTAFAVFTGLTGAMLGPVVLSLCRVKNPISRGLAMGTISHGIGASRATQESELSGAIAGAAMGIAAIGTSLVLPTVFSVFG